MLRLTRFAVFVILALALLGVKVEAKKKPKVSTKNAKQASQLQAAAVFLQPGSYTFQNVKTGQKIFYSADRKNHVFPTKGKSTDAVISRHKNSKLPWHLVKFGKKNKCLSSAWGSSSNNAAVMYVCASGKTGQKSTLEQTKQYWLFVPVSKPTVSNAKPNSYANTQLIAAQGDSIDTRNKKIAAQKATFNKRGLGEHEHTALMRRLERRALEKRSRTVKSGTFYVFATDHLVDQDARALTGKTIVTRGIKNTLLKPWKKGDKAQQWRITKH